MSITALFWDLGGVVLTDGWDKDSRQRACSRFGLDCREFEARHQLVADYFETGRISLDHYLDQTVFCQPRRFRKDEFKRFLFAQSQAHPEVLPILERMAVSGRRLMVTLNNESLELSRYRIERFRLRDYFSAFLSSGFLGVKKPDEAIYRIALNVTQRSPEECLMIDDRQENLDTARRLGIHVIHYRDPRQLSYELQQMVAAAYYAA
jgi:putative hydrolase of the HAD superfamily